MKFTKEHITILIVQITEVLGFSLILPFLPFYAQEFGANPLQIGLILSSFSFFQFLSAPVWGKLSDKYGRRPLLIFSQLSTFVSFVILAFSNSLEMIFFSRILDGILGSNFTIAQAYLSDISSKEDRSKAFGISGVAFGIGFLIGPGVGGFLSQFGYQIPSFIAAAMSFLTTLIIFVFLPETVEKREDIEISLKTFHVESFKKFFSDPEISSKLWEFFSYISAFSIWVGSFALYAQKKLGLGSEGIGYILTYIGFISIIIRGVLLSKIIDAFGEHRLRYAGMASIFLGMIGSVLATHWFWMIVIMTLFSFGSGILRPVMIGSISRSAPEDQQGAALGVANSLVSIAQIIGPLLGGFMINYFVPESLGLLSGAIILIGAGLMLSEDRRKDHRTNP